MRRLGRRRFWSATPVEPGAASEALWNRVELFEKRKDGQLAREFEIALPAELSLEENIALTREFVAGQLVSRGLRRTGRSMGRRPEEQDGIRNTHAHIMLTMRPLTEEGFGAKRETAPGPGDRRGAQGKDGRIRYGHHGAARPTFWNCASNGRTTRICAWRGPGTMSASITGATRRAGSTSRRRCTRASSARAWRRGKPADRIGEFEEARAQGAREIAERPERVLELITHRQAVFTRRDIAREINRYVDDGGAFQAILARVMASPELRQLAPEQGRQPARFSTRAMIQAERDMMAEAQRLARTGTHGVSPAHMDAALAAFPLLSDEQKAAVRHVTGRGRIAAVAGAAGAGKSTMLAAAKAAWEGQGLRVRGAALAGKAADGLREGSRIESRTIASLEWAWAQGKDRLAPRDVLVIDEAGMIGSLQLGRVLAEARKAGAKVVLVGDGKQLQPIEAGAPFRAIANRIGFAEIGTIRRQREQWAREASMDFAKGHVRDGLSAYRERGHVRFEASREEAKAAIARDWMAGRKDGKELSCSRTRVPM